MAGTTISISRSDLGPSVCDNSTQILNCSADSTPILLIAFCYPPSTAIGALRPARFAKYLIHHGFRVIVVAERTPIADPSQERDGTLYVPNVSTAGSEFGQLADLLLTFSQERRWAIHACVAASRLLKDHRIGAVMSTSPPLVAHAAALALKNAYGTKWIADLRDPVVGNPCSPLSEAEAYAAETLIATGADAILAATSIIARDFVARHPDAAERTHVLWNGYDPEDKPSLTPESAEVPTGATRRNKKFVIAHFGSIYSRRSPASIFSSCLRLLAERRLNSDQFLIRLVGTVEPNHYTLTHPDVHALVDAECCEIQNQHVERKEALRQMSQADALLLLDMPDATGDGFAAPAKLFEYILTGKPILALAPRNSPALEILRRSGVQQTCVYNDDEPQAIDDKVRSFIDSCPATTQPHKQFLEEFDGCRQLGELATILKHLLAE